MLRPAEIVLMHPSLEREWMLLAVRVIGIAKRDLWMSVQKSFDNFQPLHERMILIADFVFPGAKSAARINMVGLQRWQNFPERLVAMQPGRWITVFRAMRPS